MSKDGDRMQTCDWKFDFSSLPRWENRDLIPFVHDEFVEIAQSDALCAVYSVAEGRMMDWWGFLAILKNKENPALLLNVTDVLFREWIFVNKGGNLIFLQTNVQNSVLIVDVERELFARFDVRDRESKRPYRKIVEERGNVFRLDPDGKRRPLFGERKIRVNRLKWHAFSEFGEVFPQSPVAQR